MVKRLSMVLTCLFLFMGLAMAQTTISGTVISSEDNQPIIGASVIIDGTSTGSVTDIDGHFEFTSPKPSPSITVSYIGMKSQKLKGGANMKITLSPDDQSHQLGEVVVTGIQKMDKRLFTGATTKIDANKARLDGVADVSRSLEGRVVGVSVENVSSTFGTAPKSASAVLLLFMDLQARCGSSTVSSLRMPSTSVPTTSHLVMLLR